MQFCSRQALQLLPSVARGHHARLQKAARRRATADGGPTSGSEAATAVRGRKRNRAQWNLRDRNLAEARVEERGGWGALPSASWFPCLVSLTDRNLEELMPADKGSRRLVSPRTVLAAAVAESRQGCARPLPTWKRCRPSNRATMRKTFLLLLSPRARIARVAEKGGWRVTPASALDHMRLLLVCALLRTRLVNGEAFQKRRASAREEGFPTATPAKKVRGEAQEVRQPLGQESRRLVQGAAAHHRTEAQADKDLR